MGYGRVRVRVRVRVRGRGRGRVRASVRDLIVCVGTRLFLSARSGLVWFALV
jgi:hypothetical protein